MLKQLIQRLLDSRTTPIEASNSAMPKETQIISYGTTTTNPDSWTTVLSFIAPSDGYAKLQAKKINSLYVHLMDMQFFKLAVMILLQIHGLGWKIKHAKFPILPTQIVHGNGQQFQSKQEIPLSLMWERLVQVAFGLFHLKPQNNLVIGDML